MREVQEEDGAARWTWKLDKAETGIERKQSVPKGEQGWVESRHPRKEDKARIKIKERGQAASTTPRKRKTFYAIEGIMKRVRATSPRLPTPKEKEKGKWMGEEEISDLSDSQTKDEEEEERSQEQGEDGAARWTRKYCTECITSHIS